MVRPIDPIVEGMHVLSEESLEELVDVSIELSKLTSGYIEFGKLDKEKAEKYLKKAEPFQNVPRIKVLYDTVKTYSESK